MKKKKGLGKEGERKDWKSEYRIKKGCGRQRRMSVIKLERDERKTREGRG